MLSTSTAINFNGHGSGNLPRYVQAGGPWDQTRTIVTPWLVCDGRRVAPVTVATLPLELFQGLLGRDSIDGAILLEARLVHTFGMRFPIDVAFCTRDLRVIATLTVPRNRPIRPRFRGWAVLEASAGAFREWRLKPGSHLVVATWEEYPAG